MARRYIRKAAGYYARRYNSMINSGFEDWEAHEIVYGGNYRTFRRNKALGKNDPAIYIQRMMTWRRLYVGNLKRLGRSPEQIHNAILRLYETKGWLTHPKALAVPGVRRDPLAMLRAFRKAAMDAGDYRRPTKKGSHHALKRRDVANQGKKRARKSFLEKYEEGRGR